MTVAWIAWRSPDKVREFWDPYRSKCLDWHFKEWRVGPDGPVHAGHFLEERRPATLSLLSFVERYYFAHGCCQAARSASMMPRLSFGCAQRERVSGYWDQYRHWRKDGDTRLRLAR